MKSTENKAAKDRKTTQREAAFNGYPSTGSQCEGCAYAPTLRDKEDTLAALVKRTKTTCLLHE